MDTKEKKREQTRQPAPQQERRRKPAPEEMTRRESRPRKQAEAQAAEKRQKPQRPAERPARQKPEQRRQRPAQRDQQPAQQENRRQRPVQQDQQPLQQENRRQRPVQQPVQHAASLQRPARQDGQIRFSAPQGTGMRKSAPKMSAQEAESLRKQQRTKPQAQPAKKSALQHLISGTRATEPQDPAERAQLRRKQRASREAKKRRRALRHDTPAIIYTQPQTFNRDRLLLQLLTVTAIVAALVLGMSVFFKVQTITVAGAETYSKQAVQDASGIQVGDNLLTFSKARASAQIRAKLSYVDNIRIGIKLPDTVIIYIEELDVAYAIESNQGDWWLINSDGRVVEQINSNQAAGYTQVLGVTLDNPQPGSQAVAADFIMQNLTPEGETQTTDPTEETAAMVPITVTGAQRLASVLQILKALEANDIVGEAASVEVSDLEDITLWYGSRYEVLLGDTTRMDYKIACMNDAILQMSDYQSGILDVSFTNPNWIDQVGYTPFG